MNKKKFYASFMRETYTILVFALGGSLFYYIGTGSNRALGTCAVVAILYTVWHFAEYKRNSGEIAKMQEDTLPSILLPERVDDFAVPRYVYENGVECKKPAPKNGHIVGYRIGPSLVIVSKAVPSSGGWHRADIEPYCKKYGGKLLNHDDVMALRRYWDRIDEMREAVGQSPLPVPYFWYQAEFSIEAAHYREDLDEVSSSYSAIILKL